MITNLGSFLQVTEEDLKEKVVLKLKDNVYYLIFNTKANSLTKEFIRSIHIKLNIVEKHQGPTALVVASLTKVFSGGLDLNFLSSTKEDEDIRNYVHECIETMGRIIGLPFPTISLVRGAAVAAGCVMALAFDKVYVGGKALFWANQAANQLTFEPGALSVLRARQTDPMALRDMVMLSKRFSQRQALQSGFIDGVWEEEEAVQEVHAKAIEMATFGENKENMKKIKYEIYKEALKDNFTNFQPYTQVGYNPFSKRPKL